MFSADLIRSGTSLMVIFRVTLSRRNVRPLMMSPGLLIFLDKPRMLRCLTHPCGVEHKPSPNKSILIYAGEESSKVLVDQDETGVDRR